MRILNPTVDYLTSLLDALFFRDMSSACTGYVVELTEYG